MVRAEADVQQAAKISAVTNRKSVVLETAFVVARSFV